MADQKHAIESRAIAFVESGLAGRGIDAYAMMSTDGQKATPADKLQEFFDMLQKTTAPLGPRQISHTYFVQDAGGGPNATAICGTVSNSDWVAVQIKPGIDQAYVVVSAKARNNDWAFVVWLIPKGNDWQVEAFNANAATIVGLAPDALLEKARAQRDAGHAFNAAILYEAAQSISTYGPNFQLGIAQPIREDLAKFHAPVELTGNPPFTWNLQGKTYTVQQAGIIGIAGQTGLMFMLPQKEWKDDVAADQFNREFINAFIATHPEYSQSFSFLVARALKPDNSGGFGTVYQNGKGFD